MLGKCCEVKTTSFAPHKSSLGLDANILVLIIYILAAGFVWIPFAGYAAVLFPLVLFFIEKESKFVKFAAVQSIIISAAMTVIAIIRDILYRIVTPSANDIWDLSLDDIMSIGNSGRTVSMNIVFWLFTIINLLVVAGTVYIIIMGFNYKQVEVPILGPIAHKFSDKLDSVNINIDINKNTDPKVTCPGCGAENPAGTKFCGTCGKDMEP